MANDLKNKKHVTRLSASHVMFGWNVFNFPRNCEENVL